MKCTIRHSLSILPCLLLLFHSPGPAQSRQWNCGTCKGLTDKFSEGLTETEKGNFGGGNTDWEETYLKDYKRSEVRLVEIMERLCTKDDHACHALLEEHEELLEDWWKEEQDANPELYKWLCIDKIQVCCPKDTFGPKCSDCPIGRDNVCSGHGKCKGEGTRDGEGTCSCDKGYQGVLCEECTQDHYEEYNNETHLSCKVCHYCCERTCKGPGLENCLDCYEGYDYVEGKGCVDIDECEVRETPCPHGMYCINIIGAHKCFKCNESCDECHGPGANECKKCKENYVLHEGSCTECDGLCDGCNGVGPEHCLKCKPEAEMVEGVCIECATACDGCTGPGPENCKECKKGFERNTDSICEDVDECKTTCRLQHEVCTNTVGSYDCNCEEGYEKNSRDDCVMKQKDVKAEADKVRNSRKYKQQPKPPKTLLPGSLSEGTDLEHQEL